MPRILSAADPSDLLTAAQILGQGGVVILPTDTVYGVSASIFRRSALLRIFELKRRPPEARVPLLLGTAADLPIVAEDVPEPAWNLIDRLWPGPLTIVLPAARSVPAELLGGGRTVAVRVPGAASCLQVLESLGEPVVGTSANLSGRPPAVSAADAADQLPGADAVLVDDGAIRAGVASTVVEVTGGAVLVHRTGAVDAEALRRAIGPRVPVRPAIEAHRALTSRQGRR
jgi:L-threonylcarbamoyladenylate synthase